MLRWKQKPKAEFALFVHMRSAACAHFCVFIDAMNSLYCPVLLCCADVGVLRWRVPVAVCVCVCVCVCVVVCVCTFTGAT